MSDPIDPALKALLPSLAERHVAFLETRLVSKEARREFREHLAAGWAALLGTPVERLVDAEAVANAVSPATSAERFLKLIDRVHVDVQLRDEADTAQIVRVRQPKTVIAGQTATVRVVVIQGSTGERREVPIKVKIPRAAKGEKTGIAVLADPVEAVTDSSLSDALFADDSDAPPPPKNLPALRALYTPEGLSGLRVVAVPGVSGDEVIAAFNGDDTPLTDDDIAAIQKQVKVAQELPTVTVSGSASVDVRPR